ncbi:uncharacterized protein LOC114953506 [Acropora millepora]|uniref:uncharacterized protein LOC114953506 n=1 Tax=Acropora millepora TaxID=45264 RepID=UPI001CF42F17|nr:uncharacterized protein LOC114953506 [Acropora millepora]
MASIAARSLRGVSRTILQVTNSQCGRIAAQVRSPKLQTSPTLNQICGVSLAKQAQMNFMKNVSRTASSMCLLSSVSPLGASLVIAGSSSDLMEGSAGEDDGLVIGAWSDLEDL